MKQENKDKKKRFPICFCLSRLKISMKIFLAFIIPAFILLLVSYWFINYSYEKSIVDIMGVEVDHVRESFNDLKDHDIKALSSTLEIIIQDPKIKNVYLEKNRDELYAQTLPVFERLRSNYGITHWYFILPDGHAFLRVHNKDMHGDLIERSTFHQARDTGKIGAGIELGKTAYALRVVMPYYFEGELIGYVELGEEINHFLQRLKGQTNNSFHLVADKVFLSQDEWNSVRSVTGNERDNWNDDEKHLLVASVDEWASAGGKCFSRENLDLIEEGKPIDEINKDYDMNYGCGGFSIIDDAGIHLGAVLAEIDMHEYVSGAERTLRINIMIMLVLVLVFALMGFFLSLTILNPIKNLATVARMVSIGDVTQRAKIESEDEIGDLSRVFNLMLDEVGQSKQKISQEVERQTHEIDKQKANLEKQQSAMINILEDVEQEKNRTELLARDLEKFKLAVENASDHIVITDADGIVLYANKAVEKITGFSNEEVIGKKAGSKNLWGGLMKKEFYVEFWKTIKEDKKVFIGEFRNKRKDREEYDAAASISPILDNDGKVVFFIEIERDITKEKEIDKAKTEFVSLASHQLRTPLTAINWYVEMLMTGDAGRINKEQKNYLEEVYKGSKRMVDLVNALLNVSRIDLGTFAIDPEPTDFLKVSKDVLSELKPSIIKKKMKIEEVYDEKLPLINADPKLVRIIFQNLLSNAVKYTPENGEVSVEIKKDNKDISIKIADNGYGIPKGQQSRIFEKLFRADNARQKETDGTGLGLYVLKSIIEKNDGKIWFESAENKGTTFYVKMPLSGMKKKEGTKGLSAT